MPHRGCSNLPVADMKAAGILLRQTSYMMKIYLAFKKDSILLINILFKDKLPYLMLV